MLKEAVIGICETSMSPKVCADEKLPQRNQFKFRSVDRTIFWENKKPLSLIGNSEVFVYKTSDVLRPSCSHSPIHSAVQTTPKEIFLLSLSLISSYLCIFRLSVPDALTY